MLIWKQIDCVLGENIGSGRKDYEIILEEI